MSGARGLAMKWVRALSMSLRGLEQNLKRRLVSAALMAGGAVLLCCGAGFAIAAIYLRLSLEVPNYKAALCLAGGLGVVGLVVIAVAWIRAHSGIGRTSSPSGISRQIEEATDRIVHDAASRVRRNSSLAIFTALALGVAAGLLGPKDRS